MLQRIAQTSMDQLAAFLTSPDVAPGTPDAVPQLALMGTQRFLARGGRHFPHFHPQADPFRTPAPSRFRRRPRTAAVPLPPQKPAQSADVSTSETLTLSGHSVISLIGTLPCPEKGNGTMISTHIAGPSAPCYDHAACGN